MASDPALALAAVPFDDELIRDFAAESRRMLGEVEAALGRRPGSPTEDAVVGTALRGIHSIKGGAGFLGLDELVAACHAAEEILGALGPRRIGGPGSLAPVQASLLAVGAALARIDCGRRVVSGLDERGAGRPAVPGARGEIAFGPAVERYQPLVADLARRLGKQARLVVAGGEIEVDRGQLEALLDPLVHLLRNAVDHGLEPPGVRARAGKPEIGRVEVSLESGPRGLVVSVSDDGAGIDADVLVARALEKGFVSADIADEMDDSAALALAFVPGLTTRDAVTEVSGRGLGMDVVRSAVARCAGAVGISSRPGTGTTVRVTLPAREVRDSEIEIH